MSHFREATLEGGANATDAQLAGPLLVTSLLGTKHKYLLLGTRLFCFLTPKVFLFCLLDLVHTSLARARRFS